MLANKSNFTPPLRTHVPAPIAALNESGSHRSMTKIFTESPCAAIAVATPSVSASAVTSSNAIRILGFRMLRPPLRLAHDIGHFHC